MSKAMIIAIVAVSILFIENVVVGVLALAAGTMPILMIIQGGLSALILIGIIKGHKLAWQWGPNTRTVQCNSVNCFYHILYFKPTSGKQDSNWRSNFWLTNSNFLYYILQSWHKRS